MHDLCRIKKCLVELEQIRAALDSSNSYYNTSYEDMYMLYNIMKPKQAEKFIEGWVAHQIGGSKIKSTSIPDHLKQNDHGDIWVGKTLILGKNNIEQKSSFDGRNTIGGGQFRFYENVPWYLFFKAWDNKTFEVFLLTKSQLISEIKNRAIESNRSAFVSSQGSGVISKLNPEEKLARLDENVAGRFQDKIGWGFNPKTEKEFYTSFKEKYLVQLSEVNEIVNEV